MTTLRPIYVMLDGKQYAYGDFLALCEERRAAREKVAIDLQRAVAQIEEDMHEQ
jgi:hypothetical protein